MYFFSGQKPGFFKAKHFKVSTKTLLAPTVMMANAHFVSRLRNDYNSVCLGQFLIRFVHIAGN